MFWFIAIERIALLLMLAFLFTRMPGFVSIFRQRSSHRVTAVHIMMLGLFGIVSTMLGFVIGRDGTIMSMYVWRASPDEWVLSFALMAIVIAGLLGGPTIGLGSGLVTSIHLFFVGGLGLFVHALLFPVAGLWAGLLGRQFAKDRLVTPLQAFFIGLVPAVVYVGMIAFHPSLPYPLREAITNIILPYVTLHSIGVVVFLTMIRIVIREQENEAAEATRRALQLAEEATPFLRKDDEQQMARGLARLLYERLPFAIAVTVTDRQRVLSHVGLGHSHEVETPLARRAYERKKATAAFTPSEIQCPYESCPLGAAIIIPVMTDHAPIRYIKLYFKKQAQVSPVELVLAEGLGLFITNQLNEIRHDQLEAKMLDAELRSLQAQINPHFLFNTLHLIASLIRIDPQRARHITVELAQFMRFNMNIVKDPLIPLREEMEHVRTYTEIVTARFGDRLTITSHIPEQIGHILIPPSTIQPLVENAVQHGVKDIENGHIHIEAKCYPKAIRITVTDNGVGFPEEKLNLLGRKSLENKEGGTGLFNVRSRFLQLLGREASFSFQNEKGARVELVIPLEGDEIE